MGAARRARRRRRQWKGDWAWREAVAAAGTREGGKARAAGWPEVVGGNGGDKESGGRSSDVRGCGAAARIRASEAARWRLRTSTSTLVCSIWPRSCAVHDGDMAGGRELAVMADLRPRGRKSRREKGGKVRGITTAAE